MEESIEFMLHVMDGEAAQARQSEDQRSTVTGLIVVIAAAIQGGLTQTGFSKNALPLTITLIALGLFGMIASAKFYERHQFHTNRGRKLRGHIEELYPNTQVRSILDAAVSEHEAKYPILSKKVRLHNLWLTLQALITALGIIYTIVILVR